LILNNHDVFKHAQIADMHALMWHVYIKQGVSTMLGQIQKWVPHLKTRVKRYMSVNSSRSISSMRADTESLKFLSIGTQNFKVKRLYQRILDVCPTTSNHPRTFESERHSMIGMFVRVLIQVEYNLSICCELWPHQQ